MSTITTDDVQHLAQLINLLLSDEEVSSLRDDLGEILEYIDQLAELDTTGVEPTYQVSGLDNVWRSDEVQQDPATRELLLSLAPDKAENQVKVPKVL